MLDRYDKLRQHDHLLHVLTARQDTSYSQLKGIVADLYRTLPRRSTGEVLERPVTFIMSQALEALGHCNFDFEGGNSRVCVVPPSLERLPVAGAPTAVLTGARSMETVSLLFTKCQECAPENVQLSVEPASDELPFIPLRVEVQASEEVHLQRVASEIGIPYHSVPRAFRIAGKLGKIEEYLQSLDEPKTGELENWPGRRDYFPELFRFQKQKREVKGPRLVRYNHPHKGGSQYFLFRGNKRQEIDREWGRYAVLRETRLRPIVYDRRKLIVLIPNGARLPVLQARALCFCSGCAPEFYENEQISIDAKLRIPRPEQFGYHAYRWVDPRVIRTVAASLDQTALEAEINL